MACDDADELPKPKAQSSFAAPAGSAAADTDQFNPWKCEKCGRYHYKAFPDVGCDWCSGDAISKRLGLSQPPNADLNHGEDTKQ